MEYASEKFDSAEIERTNTIWRIYQRVCNTVLFYTKNKLIAPDYNFFLTLAGDSIR